MFCSFNLFPIFFPQIKTTDLVKNIWQLFKFDYISLKQNFNSLLSIELQSLFFSVYTQGWKGKLCIEAKEICLWCNLPLFKHLKSLLKERHWQTEKVGIWWIYLHSSQKSACWILLFFLLPCCSTRLNL